MLWRHCALARAKLLRGKARTQLITKPQFLIIGGVNGAGKSTIVEEQPHLRRDGSALLLNPDEITKVILRDTDQGVGTANFAALRQIAKQITEFLTEGHTFISETCLANAAYKRHAEVAKSSGYEVRLVYVGLPTVDHAIARVADRVKNGGHDVPEAMIRKRWKPSHDNLGWFAQNIDAVEVFSNASAVPKMVARAIKGAVEMIDLGELPAVTAVLSPLLTN